MRLAMIAATVAVIGVGAAAAQDRATDVPRLPSLGIDPGAVSVSGISSGGFMATQLHVAHARQIMGIAVLAGGPYFCAGGSYPFNLPRSVSICSDTVMGLPFLGPPDAGQSIAEINRQAKQGAIDDPAHLAGDRVYLFSGSLDEQVPASVVGALSRLYQTYVEPQNIVVVDTVPAAHAMVTADFGNACDAVAPPFINDCDYDAAGELLVHIYGPLNNPVEPTGTLLEFDQSEFFEAGAGMNERAHAYIPRDCGTGAHCRLHVALHGCRQYPENIGDAFYANAGYNRWAEANRIVVLYPQTTPVRQSVLGIPLPWPNPRGCWDWWGFTGSDYYVKSGVQVRAIAAMIERLAETPSSADREFSR